MPRCAYLIAVVRRLANVGGYPVTFINGMPNETCIKAIWTSLDGVNLIRLTSYENVQSCEETISSLFFLNCGWEVLARQQVDSVPFLPLPFRAGRGNRYCKTLALFREFQRTGGWLSKTYSVLMAWLRRSLECSSCGLARNSMCEDDEVAYLAPHQCTNPARLRRWLLRFVKRNRC